MTKVSARFVKNTTNYGGNGVLIKKKNGEYLKKSVKKLRARIKTLMP
jgi:hypothetical protein